ncbi:MAG: OmpH family outer membrane protein [Planctomycetes bacterium]|nr:OmpH family outer membrane protein [Planctomycetota bacterium]
MNKHTARALLFLATLASITLVANVSAQQQPKKKPRQRRVLKIAVVDIGLLFQKYKRKDDFESAINEQRKRLKTELDGEYENLIKMRRELEKSSFRKGSEPWLREAEKVKLAKFRWDLKKERMQSALKNEVEHNTLQILKEIKSSLGQYGRRHNYDLVLKTDNTERNLGDNERSDLVVHFQEEIFRAQISDVAYFHNSLNITKSVLIYLNTPANLKYWDDQAKKKKSKRSRKSGKAPK